MTVNELADVVFSLTNGLLPIIYVFDSEEHFENWYNKKVADSYIVFSIQGDVKTEVWLKEEWSNANVEQIYCIGKGKMAIVVDRKLK